MYRRSSALSISAPFINSKLTLPYHVSLTFQGSSKSQTGDRRESAESYIMMSPSESVAGIKEKYTQNSKSVGETASVVIDIDC